MVEFALVLPVALLLIFGLLEFGRVVNAEISAGHCANELARYGAIGGRTVAQVRDFAYHLQPGDDGYHRHPGGRALPDRSGNGNGHRGFDHLPG
jgi:hypothetical protein